MRRLSEPPETRWLSGATAVITTQISKDTTWILMLQPLLSLMLRFIILIFLDSGALPNIWQQFEKGWLSWTELQGDCFFVCLFFQIWCSLHRTLTLTPSNTLCNEPEHELSQDYRSASQPADLVDEWVCVPAASILWKALPEEWLIKYRNNAYGF